MAFWQNLQSFLVNANTLDIPENFPNPAETIKQIGNLVNGIQDNQDLQVLISSTHLNSLLDVLNCPLSQAIARGWSFYGIAKEVLKSAKSEPDLQTSVLLVSQAAYWESFQQFFLQYTHHRDRLQENSTSDKVAKQIEKLGAIEFTDKEARETLVCFHDSPLAEKFNQVLQARLQESGFSETEAQRITERISRHTHRYIQEIVADLKDKVTNLVGSYSNDYWKNAEVYSSIDKYLVDVIAKKPLEKVFDEEFCFQDIYVPLEVKPVRNGEVDKYAKAENMETWAEKTLLDKEKQVLFIQGGPGRGKSVFCRMFADWVRRELHPIYTPILIRLRDVDTFEKNFDQTLAAAIGTNFVTSDSGWLTDRNTRFLFLLDGFDELLLERGASTELKQFLEQVEGFQRRCKDNSERGHRVLITGRPLALYGIERDMPINLARVEIVLMEEDIQRQWLDRWEKVVDGEKTIAERKRLDFESAIGHKNCPREVKNLAKEPLLLYLLAAMHRDGKFNLGMFEAATAGNTKVLIYEATVQWVLEKQRGKLQQKLTKLEPEDLRSVLGEAAVGVVQSGGEHAQISMIEARLEAKEDEEAIKLIQQARDDKRNDGLKNALAAFYLKSVADRKNAANSVEFFHKSFGEFLCAERMVESFAEWTEPGKKKKKYAVDNNNLEKQIYDLFGYGHLTPEIVEYIGALWEQRYQIEEQNLEEDNLKRNYFVVLFERLNEFYLRWSDGEFIEATEDTLPQKKARDLKQYRAKIGQRRDLKQYRAKIGQRKVDIYTGLNILILLWELHYFAQKQEGLKDKIAFHPCGNSDNEGEFDGTRLLRIINYSGSIRSYEFIETIESISLRNDRENIAPISSDIIRADSTRANLSLANLRGRDLSEANLANIDLSRADLRGANLRNADLSQTDLRRADLSGADLSGANLRYAYLRAADLSAVNLSGADLYKADLGRAYLRRANLAQAKLIRANCRGADFTDAFFGGLAFDSKEYEPAVLQNIGADVTTKWFNSKGLHKAKQIPQELEKQANFKDAIQLSLGIEDLIQGRINQALRKYNAGQASIRERHGDGSISAHLMNRICWLSCLHYYLVNDIDNFSEKIVDFGRMAVNTRPQWGNYRDTLALAKALFGYLEEAKEEFEKVIECEDVKKWPDERKNRRIRWIGKLKKRINPFTEEELATLLKEEGYY